MLRLEPIKFCLFVLLLTLFKKTDQQNPTFNLEQPNMCVKEYSHDTASETNKTHYLSGESETVKCRALGKSWDFDHQNHDQDFIIYPNTVRECRSNGAWSGPTPICVSKRRRYKFEPKEVTDSSLHSQNSSKDVWQRIGQPHERCNSNFTSQLNVTSGSIKKYNLNFSFHRPYFFSFAILSNADVFSVELLTRNDGILKNVSQEGRSYLTQHYKNWQMATNESHQKECPIIISAPVFTDHLMVRYSAVVSAKKKRGETRLLDSKVKEGPANISFYRIVKCYETEELDDRQTCPEAPEIINAINVEKRSDKMTFVCNNSFTMVDPVTSRHSAGVINCIHGDWFPYPFPVCKRLNTQSTQASDELIPLNNSTASQNEPQSDITYVVAFLCLFVLGFIISVTIVMICIRRPTIISNMSGEISQSPDFESFTLSRFFEREFNNSNNEFENGVPSYDYEFGDFSQAHYATPAYDYPETLEMENLNCEVSN